MTHIEFEPVPPETDTVDVIWPVGLVPMIVITPEMKRKYRDADARYQQNRQDKNERPPKPPSGRLIGRIAFGHGF